MEEPYEEHVFHAKTERFCITSRILEKVPFLEALFADRVNTTKNGSGEPIIDRDPVLVKAVLNFVSSGKALHLFGTLPKTASARDMLQELDFFCVDPPEVRALDDASFKQELKDVSDEYMKVCRRGPVEKVHSADREGARNAAAELAIGLERGSYNMSCHKTRQQLFNCILFVVSHSRTFGPRLRWHLMALSRNLCLTSKQLATLEQ